MENKVGFRPEKATEVILYIMSKGCTNLYNILKVIYFADKMRLSKVASTMFKDKYIAISAGAVPSGAYDLLKDARDNRKPSFNVELPFIFDKKNTHFVKASRNPNMNYLSKVDIECLDDSIKKYGSMKYNQLMKISHQQLDYKAAKCNEWMPLDTIIDSVDHNGKIKSFLYSVREEVC